MFYLGTWQFEKISKDKAITLIQYTERNGLGFDTAVVYKKGEAESLLGDYTTRSDVPIVTKLPASSKPPLQEEISITEFYSSENMYNAIQNSRKRLKRNIVDIVLLHNWNMSWETKYQHESIELLQYLKNSNYGKKIGISLPNGYNGNLTDSPIFEYIDSIECPYNDTNTWIRNKEKYFIEAKKTVILRSFLNSGSTPKSERAKNLKSSILYALNHSFSFTIGASDVCQLEENVLLYNECLRSISHIHS